MEKYVLALDQGTSSSRAILFNHAGEIVRSSSLEVPLIFSHPGWVEQDPEIIWSSQAQVATRVLREQNLELSSLAAIGVTNQRETTIVWDRHSGQPIAHAISWQDRRTAAYCDSLKSDGFEDVIRRKTGLLADPYFSATKIGWLLQNIAGATARAAKGELLFGTVDSFLLWRLTGGTVHATDYSNASRTMLFNIHDLSWDEELLNHFDIPAAMLPKVQPSSGIFGETQSGILGLPGAAPIAGIAGDQQAATFGQACFEPGLAKNTYGTGCFLLMNTGAEPLADTAGLLSTIGWGLDGKVTYCAEGSVFIGGAVVQYLRDSLGIIRTAAESESVAACADPKSGVYFVPTFVGLGAPHWDPHVRGALLGLTRGSGRAEIVRAALEAVAFQSRDLIEAMAASSNVDIPALRVDGGMVQNNFLMQFQADILGVPVERPKMHETTALGAAYLAGLAVGYWRNVEEIQQNWSLEKRFEPAMSEDQRETAYAGWKKAVQHVRGWKYPENSSPEGR